MFLVLILEVRYNQNIQFMFTQCCLFSLICFFVLFEDKSHPTLCKSLRNQKVMYISCGEDHTVALTKVRS